MHVMSISMGYLSGQSREQRLHSCDLKETEFNIKLDGRPLGGVYM